MRIIVAGYIVGFPMGGMSWHHLNYLAGLRDLGHDVWFYEDSGQWSLPYNPQLNTESPDPTYGIGYLRDCLRLLGLDDRYCYHSELQGRWYGKDQEQWLRILDGADLLICVSGVTPWRDEFSRVARRCVIDTDPVATQLRLTQDPAFLEYYRAFDAVATFGPLVGTPGCPLPTSGLSWIGTCQPVALAEWPRVPVTSRRFSTLGQWDFGRGREIRHQGRTYHIGKGMHWMQVRELPRHVPFEMELAMTAMPDEARRTFVDAGWRLRDPVATSASARSYRDFIREVAGEFTVAKHIYTALPSGWFSERSACFLATGRPVVTQHTGFDTWLPTGHGLFAFDSMDDAAAALQAIAGDYELHAKAARDIAEAHFDARKVLRTLIEQVTA